MQRFLEVRTTQITPALVDIPHKQNTIHSENKHPICLHTIFVLYSNIGLFSEIHVISYISMCTNDNIYLLLPVLALSPGGAHSAPSKQETLTYEAWTVLLHLSYGLAFHSE